MYTFKNLWGKCSYVFLSSSQASQNHSTEMNISMDICTYLKGQRTHQQSQKILHEYNKIQTTVQMMLSGYKQKQYSTI